MRNIVLVLLACAIVQLLVAPLRDGEQWSVISTAAMLFLACVAAAIVTSLFGTVRLWWVRWSIRRMR
jgi:hypothetical protein